MGFWSSILPAIGSVVGAPFTGGASLSMLPGLIGSVGSGLAAGAQKGREADNAAAMNTALFNQREAQNKYEAGTKNAELDLDRRKFSQGSQSDAYLKALKSALALNMQDANIQLPSRIPKFNISGGMRPSALGAEGKAAAGELNKQALAKLMGGESFDALPTYGGVAAPAYRKPGVFENIAGVAGMAGNAINGLQGAGEDRSAMQSYIDAIKKLSERQSPFVGDALGGSGGATA